jgi:hypothetical protein
MAPIFGMYCQTSMTKLTYLKYFWGIEVARSRHGIFLSQRKYVLDPLKETRMLGCKIVDNPVDSKLKDHQ